MILGCAESSPKMSTDSPDETARVSLSFSQMLPDAAANASTPLSISVENNAEVIIVQHLLLLTPVLSMLINQIVIFSFFKLIVMMILVYKKNRVDTPQPWYKFTDE